MAAGFYRAKSSARRCLQKLAAGLSSMKQFKITGLILQMPG